MDILTLTGQLGPGDLKKKPQEGKRASVSRYPRGRRPLVWGFVEEYLLQARQHCGRKLQGTEGLRAFLRPVYVHIIRKLTPSEPVEARYLGIPLFVDPRDEVSYPYLIGEVLEPLEISLCMHLLRPGDIALDIGANYGGFTVVMAQAVGPNGKVYAFEPAPRTFELLRRTIERNRFDWVEVLPFALTNQEGVAPFILRSRSAVSSLLGREDDIREGEVISVPTTTLDAFFEDIYPPIRLIKMDTEGAESHILQGAQRVLQSSPQLAILSEVGRPHLHRFGLSPEGYVESLRKLGFRIYYISYQKRGPVPSDAKTISRLLEGPHRSVNILAVRPNESLPENLYSPHHYLRRHLLFL